MGWILGVCHPTPTRDLTFEGIEFREDEIPLVIAGFTYKPVYVSHNYERRFVGLVDSEYERGPNGELICSLFIDESCPEGAQLMQDVHAKRLRGLSLGSRANYLRDEAAIIDLHPHEISVCEQGELEDTWILAYGDSKRIWLCESAFNWLYRNTPSSSDIGVDNNTFHNLNTDASRSWRDIKTMTDAMQTQQAAVAAGAPPVAPPVVSQAPADGAADTKGTLDSQIKDYAELAKVMKEGGMDVAGLKALMDRMNKYERMEAEKKAAEVRAKLHDPENGLFPFFEDEGLITDPEAAIKMQNTVASGFNTPVEPLIMLTCSTAGTAREYKKKLLESNVLNQKYAAENDILKKKNEAYENAAGQKRESDVAIRTQDDRKRVKGEVEKIESGELDRFKAVVYEKHYGMKPRQNPPAFQQSNVQPVLVNNSRDGGGGVIPVTFPQTSVNQDAPAPAAVERNYNLADIRKQAKLAGYLKPYSG